LQGGALETLVRARRLFCYLWKFDCCCGIKPGMESAYNAIKEWISDPVVAAVLGFIVTSAVLKYLSRLMSSRKK